MRKALLLAVIIMIMGLLVISGCDMLGGAEDDPVAEEEEAIVDQDNPESVVHSFVDAMRDLDLDRAEELVSSDYLEEFEREFDDIKLALVEDTPEAAMLRQMFEVIFDSFEVDVIGSTVEGDEAIVHTVNTHPDPDLFSEMLMSRILEIMFSGEVDMENITEEEGMELMVDVLREVYPEVDKIETEVDVPMVMEDGQWKIAGEVISDYTVDLDM